MTDINNSCPADLEPYGKAYQLGQKHLDRNVWMWVGNYGMSAFGTILDRMFNGQKSQSEYIDSPVLMREEMAEQKIQQQRELFMAKLEAMKTNFEISKSQP